MQPVIILFLNKSENSSLVQKFLAIRNICYKNDSTEYLHHLKATQFPTMNW